MLMKKFTFILSLLVAMVTTAFAQTFDATKQYYLKGTAIVGTNKATGYMNLGEFGKNTNVMLLDNKQALSLEMMTNATGGVYYLIAAEVANATGGSAKMYIAAASGDEASWKPVLTNDANAALKFTFEMSPMSTTTTTVYNIKSDKGYLKVDNVTKTDNSKGVYTNGEMTSAAAWEVVEAKAEEEEVVKQYCLKGKGYVGATSVAGYMKLVGSKMMDTEAILADEAQALVMEKVVDGTNTYYTISTDVENATDKQYVAYDAAKGLVCTANPANALRFQKEVGTTAAFNLKSDYGYVEARKAYWGATDSPTPVDDGTIGLYLDGNNATMALSWTYEEVVPVTATAPVVESITPANGATVENLTEVVITFDKEIAKYDSSVDNNRGMRLNVTGATVYISEVAISGNTATCTLASELTKSGEYTIKIPAGSFIAADGGVFAGSDTNKFTFNGAPVFAANSNKATVENKLDVIRVSFDQNVAFVANHNIEKLEVKSGETTVGYITLSENAKIDDAVLTLTLDKAIEPKAETTYTVEIPAGLIVETDGTKQFAGGKVTYKVTVIVPLTAEITPTSGTVLTTELTEIVVVFSENVYKSGVPAPKLVNAEDNTIEYELGYSINENVLTLTPKTAIPNGTYSLVNWVAHFQNEAGKTISDPNYTITVNLPTTAIDAVAADADAVIYDLSGRRVKEITVKGIYIVNGKKVIR